MRTSPQSQWATRPRRSLNSRPAAICIAPRPPPWALFLLPIQTPCCSLPAVDCAAGLWGGLRNQKQPWEPPHTGTGIREAPSATKWGEKLPGCSLTQGGVCVCVGVGGIDSRALGKAGARLAQPCIADFMGSTQIHSLPTRTVLCAVRPTAPGIRV